MKASSNHSQPLWITGHILSLQLVVNVNLATDMQKFIYIGKLDIIINTGSSEPFYMGSMVLLLTQFRIKFETQMI